MFATMTKIYHAYVRAYANVRGEVEIDVGRRFVLFIIGTAILIAGAMLVNYDAGLILSLLVVPTFYHYTVMGLFDYNFYNCNVEDYARGLRIRFSLKKDPSLLPVFIGIGLFNAVVIAFVWGHVRSPEYVKYSAVILFGIYSVLPAKEVLKMAFESIPMSIFKIGFVEKWLNKHYNSQ